MLHRVTRRGNWCRAEMQATYLGYTNGAVAILVEQRESLSELANGVFGKLYRAARHVCTLGETKCQRCHCADRPLFANAKPPLVAILIEKFTKTSLDGKLFGLCRTKSNYGMMGNNVWDFLSFLLCLK